MKYMASIYMFTCLHTKVLSSVTTLYTYDFCLYTVISEPDNVTICEGGSTTFTCVLDSSISSDDVQWYRLVKGTNTSQRVSRAGNDFVDVPVADQNKLTTTLYIFNARRSYTGYYWVRLPSDDVCNVYFTVSTGLFGLNRYTYICLIVYDTVHMYMCAYIT